MERLHDQVAIVTGASGEIGRRIAAALAREGAAVLAHDGRDPQGADAVVRTIEAAGGRAQAARGDLSRPAEAAAVVASAAAAFGRLDILVNNMAIAGAGSVLAMEDDAWQAVVAATLNGPFFCMRAALREFVRQRRGRIITVTSPAGEVGGAAQANYVTATAGLVGLTRAVAREVGSRAITVNAVAPGTIVALADGVSDPGGAPGMIPLGRAGSADEIAAAVVFLASDEAGYITGQVLNVDGGMIMH